LKQTLLSILVLVSILVASALITNLFARAMYRRCTACGEVASQAR